MAIITMNGHVSRALDFYHKTDVYFSIGKISEWAESDRTKSTSSSNAVSDYSPPSPELSSDIVELVGMKKVERMFLVVPDENGSLVYRDSRWKIIAQDKALDKGARWVYLSASLNYNELPIDISYRMIGINTGITRKSGISKDKYVLEADEISDKGITEIIDFRRPIYRETGQREELAVVIEF